MVNGQTESTTALSQLDVTSMFRMLDSGEEHEVLDSVFNEPGADNLGDNDHHFQSPAADNPIGLDSTSTAF
jgi:hypothetical protein